MSSVSRFFLALLALVSATIHAQEINSPHATVRLVSSQASVNVGEPLQLGLYFEIEPEWHIYWRNPGDSGTPLSVAWELPTTNKIDSQKWPLPKRIPVGPLANYGYDGNVLIPYDLEWTPESKWSALDKSATSIKIIAKADWLICKVECLPASGTFTLELPIERGEGVDAEISADKHLFDKVQYPNFDTISDAKVLDRGTHYEVVFAAPVGFTNDAISWDFFSGDELRIQHADIPTFEVNDQKINISILKDTNAPATIASLSGLVIAQGKDPNDRVGFEIKAPFGTSVAAPEHSLVWLLLFAFLGGLILNVMPCVFPVLSLKILSFVHEAGEKGGKQKLRNHGWVFALGVLISFWALAALLLVLRQSGQALGWGFQLQSPLFVSGLVVLFFLIGLNFIGFLEINFSGGKLGSIGAGRGGYTSSFLSGILATIVATPCTAPFMGVALGAALSLPPLTSLLIFTFLGLGMAAPYVVLSYNPRWLSILPRPGVWMETLRQFLAFPIFATSLWLLWVLSQQNPDQVITILLVALLLAFLIWVLRAKMSCKKKWLFCLLSAASLFWVVQSLSSSISSSKNRDTARADDFWQPYTPVAFDKALATTEYVFVDFTASWCITCQVNKKVVLNTSEAQAFFAKNQVIAMRADWTHQDPQITQLLESIGRSSVPTYAIFRRDRKDFALLPEILTQQILNDKVQEFINSGGK